LLRARAIENQSYVLASAQGGTHDNGRKTWGHSMFINPWGEIIHQLKDGEGFILGELNRQSIDDVRANLPALHHRTL
jgi:nitrilase